MDLDGSLQSLELTITDTFSNEVVVFPKNY